MQKKVCGWKSSQNEQQQDHQTHVDYNKKNNDQMMYSNTSSSSSDLSLRNLSKVILPPLGASTYNQTQMHSSPWIISPMDSTYRYLAIIYIHLKIDKSLIKICNAHAGVGRHIWCFWWLTRRGFTRLRLHFSTHRPEQAASLYA